MQQKFRGYYRTWHPLNSFAYENTKLNIASSPKIILPIKSRSIFVYNRLFITSVLVTWSCGFSIWLNWQPIWTCRYRKFQTARSPAKAVHFITHNKFLAYDISPPKAGANLPSFTLPFSNFITMSSDVHSDQVTYLPHSFKANFTNNYTVTGSSL